MEAEDYFKTYVDYFWQWEEEGTVLAIPDGPTIAYKEFVVSILEHLSRQGLPSFGSLVLTLIATNPGGDKALEQVYRIVEEKLDDTDSISDLLSSAMEFLRILPH